jgi:hypothetical protein
MSVSVKRRGLLDPSMCRTRTLERLGCRFASGGTGGAASLPGVVRVVCLANVCSNSGMSISTPFFFSRV